MLKTAFATWPEFTKGQLCSFIPDGALLMAGGGFSGNVIDDSVIFNAGDANTVKWTAGTPTSQDIWTISFWVKRTEQLATRQNTFGVSSGSHNGHLGWAANDTFELYNDDSVRTQQKFTSGVHRDPTAWTHWCISFSGAGPNEVVFEKDGVVQSQTTGTDDTLTGGAINKSGADMVIGDWLHASGVPADMILAQFAFVDGTVYSASDFGEFDANGNWGPKSDTDIQALTFGNNGIFLRNGTDIQAGTDTSGNSQSVTVTGLASSDVVSDSPTNSSDGVSGNYAVLNLLDQSLGGCTFSEGNLTVLTGSSTYGPVCSTLGFDIAADRIVRFEVTCDADSSGDFFMIGAIKATDARNSSTQELGHTTNGYAYRGDNGQLRNSDAETAYGSTYATGDVIDVFAGKGAIWFAKNGTLQNSATQSEIEAGTTTNAAASGLSGTYLFAVGDFSGSQTITVSANFGQSAFTNTFASITTKPLNSKTIADEIAPTITNPTDMFVHLIDTGDAIEAALTAATSGWDYWEIIKNREGTGTQNWRHRFSHDSSNEYTQGTVSTYQSLVAETDTEDYVGWRLRIGSAYGTAAGTVSHTNGVATTITHNLGNARCFILLYERDSSKEINLYHPDFDSGDLCFWTAASAPAASTNITSIGANSFDIGSGMPTNDYDYLVVAESDIIKFGKYVGNANTDGPIAYSGLRPVMELLLGDNAEDLRLWSRKVKPANIADTTSNLNSNASESADSTRYRDGLAVGMKARATHAAQNGSSVGYFHVHFAEQVFDPNLASGQPRAV